jgi:hypothetical protein
MKRTLQWTTFAVACGLLVAALATARPTQGDAVAAADANRAYGATS